MRHRRSCSYPTISWTRSECGSRRWEEASLDASYPTPHIQLRQKKQAYTDLSEIYFGKWQRHESQCFLMHIWKAVLRQMSSAQTLPHDRRFWLTRSCKVPGSLQRQSRFPIAFSVSKPTTVRAQARRAHFATKMSKAVAHDLGSGQSPDVGENLSQCAMIFGHSKYQAHLNSYGS